MTSQHLTELPPIGAQVARVPRCKCAQCASFVGEEGTVIAHHGRETFSVLFGDTVMSTGLEQVRLV